MPSSFIAHWQLKRYGETREAVCGPGQHRPPDETWPLPQHLRTRLGALLQELGFEPSREISVRELALQRSCEEERERRETERKRQRLQSLDEVAR